jgi:hypothetical protein
MADHLPPGRAAGRRWPPPANGAAGAQAALGQAAALHRPAGAVHRSGTWWCASASSSRSCCRRRPTPWCAGHRAGRRSAAHRLRWSRCGARCRPSLIAAVVGVPLGVLLGSNERAYRSVEFLIDFFRSTPSSALIPLFLLIFGVSDINKVAIAAFGALLIVVFNSAYGVINARKQRVMAAKVMGASRWQHLQGRADLGKPAADVRRPALGGVDGAGDRDRGRDVHRLRRTASATASSMRSRCSTSRACTRPSSPPARWAMRSTSCS